MRKKRSGSEMAGVKCCSVLGFYWFFEACWFLLFAASYAAIEMATELPDGLVYQVAILGCAFHAALLACVLYAMESKANPAIALGILLVIITDSMRTLHAGLHLSHVHPGYDWKAVLEQPVSTILGATPTDTLYDALHVNVYATPTYHWAFILNLIVPAFALAIDFYAMGWFIAKTCRSMRGDKLNAYGDR